MHNRLLVTLNPPADADSERVRRNVHDQLLADDSFCGNGGRFGHPLCDWFVIGGRWSGLLAETLMSGAYRQAVRTRFPDMNREWLPQSLITEHAADLDAIWQAFGGSGLSPYTRCSHEDWGYPDDAMLLSRGLYTALLAEHEGQDSDRESYADLDGDELHPDFIGRKWLVVVDYHS